MDETIKTSNHPKLRKLADLLTIFFSDPMHADKSKVIVFTQYRDSAKEIKAFLDNKCPLVKSEYFLG